LLSMFACSSSSSGTGSGQTFSCGSNNCGSGTQYCLKNESGPTYSCVNLPSSGCTTGQLCETCLKSVPNQEGCSEVTINGVTDVEVDTTQ
jgi:hypothetical protein